MSSNKLQWPNLALSSENLDKLLLPIKLDMIKDRNLREKCAKIIWRNLRNCKSAVCFDLDSTLIQEESIDEFARWLGKDLSAITRQTMDGNLSFRHSLLSRLEMLSPTNEQYASFVAEFAPKLTQGIEELVAALREHNIELFIVTGGFVEIAAKVARMLNIPVQNIFANRIKFDQNGTCVGIDKSQFTSQSGPAPVGKAGVCQFLKQKHGYRLLVMIGDGSTDLEARPPADLFIGFGGNQVRTKVLQGSDWFVREFRTLTECLNCA